LDWDGEVNKARVFVFHTEWKKKRRFWPRKGKEKEEKKRRVPMAHVCAPQLSELEPNLPVGFPDDPRGRVVDLIERDRPTSPAGVDAVVGWTDGSSLTLRHHQLVHFS
jgi:hypothetical protein